MLYLSASAQGSESYKGLWIYGGPGSMISKYGPSLSKAVGPVDPSFLVVKKSYLNKKILILQRVYNLHKTDSTCRFSIQ